MLSTTAMAGDVSGFYQVVVNGVMQPGFAFLVFDDEHHAYMAHNDFMNLRVAVTPASVIRDSVMMVPLFGQTGVMATVDPVHLILTLEISSAWYVPTRINLHASEPGKLVAAPPGMLLNYGLQAEQTQYNNNTRSYDSYYNCNSYNNCNSYDNDNSEGGEHFTVSSGQNLAVFGPQGLLQLITAETAIGDSNQEFSRLATTYLRDNEEKLTTLSIGDGVVSPATGIPGVRYGGISWQSNFDLDPTFSTLENPAIFDEARLPSTLEFFLNDRRIGAPLSVEPGAFEISGLPTVDSSGLVKVVIRDALNNERIVLVPYIHTAQLYREGLHGFSYTAGELRPELELYEDPFIATVHRWGVARRLTLGLGGAASADRQSLGTSATYLLPWQVIGDTGFAVSQSEAGAGQQAGTSLQWQSGVSSMGASVNHYSETFRLLGDSTDATDRPQDELQLFAARSMENVGSVSATWGKRSTWSGATQTVTSVGWSRSFRDFIVSLNALHSDDGTTNDTTIMLTVSVPLESHGFISGTIQQYNDDLAMRTDYTSAPVTDTGVAYHLGMTSDLPFGGNQQPTYYGGVDARSTVGEHGIAVENGPGQTSWRAQTAGSVGVLAGRTFVAPPINSGFAMVTTGDAPGIPVYRWNLPVAISDSHGQAIVTSLSPYQNNLLAVRPEEVPFEYRITSNEVTAVPRGRGGVLIEFNMIHEQPALVVLQLANGEFVPAGAVVKLIETGEIASVGLRGEVYLANVPEQAEVEVTNQNNRCHVVVQRLATSDPQPRLGPYLCDMQLTR